MSTVSKGLIIGGTYYSGTLAPNQVDGYTALLAAGTTYYFRLEAATCPIGYALLAPNGSIVQAKLMTPGQFVSYTPTISGAYVLGLDTEFGAVGSYTVSGGYAWVNLDDTSTGFHAQPFVTPYSGPVNYLTSQFIDVSKDNLNITATSPNVFLHSGAGMDGLTVISGDNILDGSTNSNFLIGGTGHDTFYMDDRNPNSPIFSTVVNFHAGDAVTVWGVNATDFQMIVLDNQGATGAKGLDIIYTAPGHLAVSFVLAGYTSTDLTNGRLTMSYGRTQDLVGLPGSPYMTMNAH